MRSRRLTLLTILLLAAAGAVPAAASVLLSKQEALEQAFPDAERIAHRSVVLSEDEKREVEGLAHARLDSRLVTLYTAYLGERVTGYALIDLHTVRTLPAALMVVLTPGGEVRSVRMLAFYEPPEYRPSDRWLHQFEGPAGRIDRLRPGGEIHGIAGSTLSSRMVSDSVRRCVALYEVLVAAKQPEPDADSAARRPEPAAHEAALAAPASR